MRQLGTVPDQQLAPTSKQAPPDTGESPGIGTFLDFAEDQVLDTP